MMTPRLAEVKTLVLTGMNNKQLAERLGIKLQTAKDHVTKLFKAESVKSREELRAKYPVEYRPWEFIKSGTL